MKRKFKEIPTYINHILLRSIPFSSYHLIGNCFIINLQNDWRQTRSRNNYRWCRNFLDVDGTEVLGLNDEKMFVEFKNVKMFRTNIKYIAQSTFGTRQTVILLHNLQLYYKIAWISLEQIKQMMTFFFTNRNHDKT